MIRLPRPGRPARRPLLRRLLVGALALALSVTAAMAPRQAQALTSQQVFINSVVAGAQKGWVDYGVPASVTIAQAILETGWGRSSLSSKYNNYFGIKCGRTPSPYQSGCVDMVTTEYKSDGTPYTIVDSFRTYSSPAMSMVDHGYFLTVNSRYAPAFAFSNEPVKFAQAMRAAGYATDPDYAHYLYRLMSQYSLFQYDFGKTLGSPLSPAPLVTVNQIVYPQRREVAASPEPVATASPTTSPSPTSVTPTVSATPTVGATPTARATPTPVVSATPSATPPAVQLQPAGATAEPSSTAEPATSTTAEPSSGAPTSGQTASPTPALVTSAEAAPAQVSGAPGLPATGS